MSNIPLPGSVTAVAFGAALVLMPALVQTQPDANAADARLRAL